MRHHEDAIARYVARVSPSPQTLAVVITGSLARGTEREDSDVDLYLIVTEEAWRAAFAEERLMFVETESAEYPHGYFDIKLATLSYLDDAAERGDDPVRDSFAHSTVAFSRVDDLEDRLKRITSVPAASWDARVDSFLAQVQLHGGYFLVQGYEHHNPVLLHHAAVHLVTAASRMLLAYNHAFFQGPKYLAKAVDAVPNKPENWAGLVLAVLDDPSPATSGALMNALESYADWGLSPERGLSTFILDNELAWRYRTKTPEYS